MLFKLMLKEEWRIHSTLFGNFLFVLFPVILLVFSFIGALTIPIFINFISGNTMATMAHYMFLLFGVSVGGFGLFGKEAMNRRFGQASLLAYSSRSLPISERSIFLDFFVKDVFFYLLLWGIPILGGLGFALFLVPLEINILLAFTTLTLSFLIGLSVVFLLSTIYAHSSKIMVFVFILMIIFAGNFLNLGLTQMLPSLTLFFFPNSANLFNSLILVTVPTALSLIFIKVDYPQKKRQFKNSLDPLSKRIGTKYSQFVAKDFLDLDRSEGGLGKIIFSFLFPLLILWVLLSVFLKFLPGANLLVIFALFLGIISSSIYNWLTEFDLFSSYSFLPLKVSHVIRSKLISYAIINSISLAILVITTVATGQFLFFIPAFCTFLFVSLYALAVVLYLTGLHPNIMLYNAKTFALYIAAASPVLLILIFLSMWNVFSMILLPLVFPIPVLIIRKGFRKWDNWQSPNF